MDFRRQHGRAYRAYRRSLNQFAALLLQLDDEGRQVLIDDRREYLQDTRADLRRLGRESFAASLPEMSLGLIAGAIELAAGNPVSATGELVGSMQALIHRDKGSLGPLTYLFRAQAQWQGR